MNINKCNKQDIKKLLGGNFSKVKLLDITKGQNRISYIESYINCIYHKLAELSYRSYRKMLSQVQNNEKQANKIIKRYLIRNDTILELTRNILFKSVLSKSFIDSTWDGFLKKLIDYLEVEKDYNEKDCQLKIEEFQKDFSKRLIEYLLWN